MKVSLGLFNDVLSRLLKEPRLSFDTETTGLRPFHGDRLFSLIFSNGSNPYYFNFQDYPDEGEEGLPRHLIRSLAPLFEKNGPELYIHNAKFDMNIMYVDGVEVKNQVWCTQTMARVLYNDYIKYDLASCAERIGEKKDAAVEEYVKKHKLWEWVTIPGKKKRSKIKYYDQVPFRIIHPYGEQDATVCYKLGEYQRKELSKITLSTPENMGKVSDIVDMEKKGTHVFHKIERKGVPVDLEYCEKGAEHEHNLAMEAQTKIEQMLGFDYKDSNLVHEQAFSAMGVDFPRTAKGNPSFPDEFLGSERAGELGKLIQEYRSGILRGGTYFQGFRYWADEAGLLHPNMKQAGTGTGRLSYSNPNLQNMPKEDTGKFPVRAAIIPPPDYFLCAIDYDQMEFKLMLDYSGQRDLIKKIKEGYDAHTTTSELCDIPRREAKILNFGLLYGMGNGLLSEKLGCTVKEAKDFKSKYFSSLPKVKKFIRKSTYRAENSKYVTDWMGRRFQFKDKRFAYKAANAIIQGGCSSIVRTAMNQLDDFLAPHKTHMLLQIHDELLFAIHKDEGELIPKIKKIMENAYPPIRLPMTCSVSIGEKNFFEMKEVEYA